MAEPSPTPLRRSRRWRRIGLGALLLIVLGVVSLELVARFYLGLGTPMLYIRDPEIEYLNAPNQDIRRFGNRVVINRYSQRSEDIEPTKSNPNELRILLLGDSIIFGGTQLDQSLTVGSILEHDLAQTTNRPVRVLTAAAGSWGPPNVAAYLKRFGTFDADIAIWVMPSDDWFDAMRDGSHIGQDPSFPVRKPWLASTELVIRYVWPRLKARIGLNAASPDEPEPIYTLQTPSMVQAVTLVRATGKPIILAHWPAQDKLGKLFEQDADYVAFRDAALAAGAEFVDLTPALRHDAKEPAAFYRDGLHASTNGARWLADQLLASIHKHLPASQSSNDVPSEPPTP